LQFQWIFKSNSILIILFIFKFLLFSLCRELDDELRQILDDVNEFSVADVNSSSDTILSITNNNNSIYSDCGFVEEHLEECVIQFSTT
jgi:hypothetical protein